MSKSLAPQGFYRGRPVTLTVDIDGRKYRLTGMLWANAKEQFLTGPIKPIPAQPPFARSGDATIVEEGASC